MNSLDPIILFFLLGLAAGLLRSELRLPAAVYDLVSMVLLLSIGLKGGVELARQPFGTLAPQMLAVLLMGLLQPLAAYPVLRCLGRLERPDAASIAAHYGSVSVGTYAVAAAWFANRQVPFEEHMPLLLTVLEVPAILCGILLARGFSRELRLGAVAHEVFLGKGIVLLIGGLLIGWAAGAEGLTPIKPLFFDLFRGILALFLLEMGLITSAQFGSLRRHGLFLLLFGVGMPLASAVVGALLGCAGHSGGQRLLYRGAGGDAHFGAPGQSHPLPGRCARGDLSLQRPGGHPAVLWAGDRHPRFARSLKMTNASRKLLTIVTEHALEGVLLKDLERLGAGGYTITDARGKGTRGVRNSAWDATGNIRVEVVCDAATAEAIAAHLQARYYDNYAMILFTTDVAVLRPEKF